MDALTRLVDALRCLPGIGPKSAQRMVFYLLKKHRQRGLHLAACIEEAMQVIHHCKRCNNYTELEFCKLCQNSSRDSKMLCVVENPADLTAVEQSNTYTGSYFVLMGKISPLDGLGPEEIGLSRLQDLVIKEEIREVILALSPTMEGQATVHFIQELFKNHPVKISQFAHGLPAGSELEFLDGCTIGTALRNRASINL